MSKAVACWTGFCTAPGSGPGSLQKETESGEGLFPLQPLPLGVAPVQLIPTGRFPNPDDKLVLTRRRQVL